MGIQVEFNPDLALRAYGTLGRLEAECLPKNIEEGRTYEFLKQGQRAYWLEGEMPLVETKGEGRLSSPIAIIQITEETHFSDSERIWTRGKYHIIKLIKPGEICFNGFNRIK